MSQTALVTPNEAITGATVRLSKPISAIQVQPKEDGDGTKLGLLSQLGPGTRVVVCGEGFNERMVKVRANEDYYFVFTQDLELLKV